MKTDLRGHPDDSAQRSANEPVRIGPSPRWGRRLFVALVIAVVAAVGAVIERHAILGLLLTRGLGVLTGERIAVGSFHIGSRQAVFDDVHVRSRAGDPLFDARRVTLRYVLHALGGSGGPRLGLTALRLDEPVFSLVREADGSYNVRSLGGSRSGSGGTGAQSSAWAFDLRVTHGELRLIDRSPTVADLAEQRIVEIGITARVRSAGRTVAAGSATVLGRESQNESLRRWPLALRATVDYPRGIAVARADAERLPLRGLVGFLQHSPAVRVDDGVLHAVVLKMYAADISIDRPLTVRLGGSAGLERGRLAVSALKRPVSDIRGQLILVDDGIWSTRLDARLAGIPLVARGGVFDRLHPTLRLGIAGDGDLRQLRRAFGFAQNQPVRGAVHVETLLEAPIANLLIRTDVSVGRGYYARVPVDDLRGRVDYHAGAVVLDGLRGRYGRAEVAVGARFLLGAPLDSAIVATAAASGGSIPYGENLAPASRVDLQALITGGGSGYRAAGALGVSRGGTGGDGMFAIDERGVGEFGPLVLHRSDGSSLVGALRLERPASLSAAWVSAERYAVAVPAVPARFAGLNVPAFPPVAGTIDGVVAGAGSPSAFALRGALTGTALRVGNARLGSGRVAIGGTLADVRLAALAVNGPLGRFFGSAAAARGTFALRGDYSGSLERLVPLTGNQQAYGAVSGHVLATLGGNDVVVQSPDAALRGGRLRGVAVDSAAGTLAVRANALHVIVASGAIAGAHAVAAESEGAVAVSAPNIPSSALRGTGLPLEAGAVSAYGTATIGSGPQRFSGLIDVRAGRTAGYRVAGDARIDVDGTRARISDATAALGATFGKLTGTLDGLGAGALRYDLVAGVPFGDIGAAQRDLHLPVRDLAGSFDVDLHVGGSGTHPTVFGRLAVPEGNLHGLAFRAAAANLELGPGRVVANDGTLTVGHTTTALSATIASGAFGLSARSEAADLDDFNDYFDAAGTLGGRGAFALDLHADRAGIVTAGALDLADLRWRAFALGDTSAHWATHGDRIEGEANAGSAIGSLDANVAIVPRRGGGLVDAFREGAYGVRAKLANVDLGAWLTAAGSALPVSGKASATIAVAGSFPRLTVAADARLADAVVAGIAVPGAHLRGSSSGSRIRVTDSDVDLGFAKLVANGLLGLAPGDPLAFDLRVSAADAGRAAARFVPALRGRDVGGALTADIRLSGTRAAPAVAGGFDLEQAHYAGFTVPHAIGELALAGKSIEVRDAEIELAHGQAIVAGSLPLVLHPFGVGPSNAPLSVDVTAHGIDLAQFTPLFPAGTTLGGDVDGRFGVEGTVERPQLFGSLAVTGGAYSSPFERALISHVGAELAFAGTSVALKTFHADVGRGSLDGGGAITLPSRSSPQTRYSAQVTANAATFDLPAYGRGTLDGTLDLTGRGTDPLLSGTVRLSDAVIPVSAVYGAEAVGNGSGATQLALDPRLAVRASAGDNVRIRSAIVDIGVTGGVDVGGTLRAPNLAGAFEATDGTISSYNHVFKIVRASVAFDPADGTVPTIEARAVSRVRNPDPDPSRNISGAADIFVNVSGTADQNNLQVTYSSEPAYSQEQIIGLLLDVPALLGAVNFDLNGAPGSPVLRGAPGETNVLLPPGVTPEQVSPVSLNAEVFSLLNGQFTQRALSPVERTFQRVLGLSDVEFTVDYGGGIGYSLRRQLGKRDFSAFVSQTVTYPERVNVGFELVPKPYERVNFIIYSQNGVTSLITNQTPGEEFFGSGRRLTTVQPLGNRAGVSLNYSRRF